MCVCLCVCFRVVCVRACVGPIRWAKNAYDLYFHGIMYKIKRRTVPYTPL